MQLKIKSFISLFALLLIGVISPFSSDAVASTAQIETPGKPAARSTNRPDIVAVAYGTEAFSDYARSRPDAEVSAEKLPANKLGVSSVSDVDVWTMLLAIFGLISLRLWHGGKKDFPAIN